MITQVFTADTRGCGPVLSHKTRGSEAECLKEYIYVLCREMHDSEIEEEIREAFRQGDPGTFRDIRRNIPI